MKKFEEQDGDPESDRALKETECDHKQKHISTKYKCKYKQKRTLLKAVVGELKVDLWWD